MGDDPPGRLIEQIEKGGRITVGNMTWTAKADVYFGGLKKVQENIDKGILVGPALPYVTNNLTIMVPKGNPGISPAWPIWASRTFAWRCRTLHMKALGVRSRRR